VTSGRSAFKKSLEPWKEFEIPIKPIKKQQYWNKFRGI
jgi:hypothetical protein